MRVKNISNNTYNNTNTNKIVQYYNEEQTLGHRIILPKQVIEVFDNYLVQSLPSQFKEVEKPIVRYNTQRAGIIGGSVLGFLLGILTKVILG